MAPKRPSPKRSNEKRKKRCTNEREIVQKKRKGEKTAQILEEMRTKILRSGQKQLTILDNRVSDSLDALCSLRQTIRVDCKSRYSLMPFKDAERLVEHAQEVLEASKQIIHLHKSGFVSNHPPAAQNLGTAPHRRQFNVFEYWKKVKVSWKKPIKTPNI